MAGRESIRVVLADAHELIREGIKNVLRAKPGLNIVAEAQSGNEAIDYCVKLLPEILILGGNMQDLPLLNIVRQLKNQCPDTRIIILAASMEADIVQSLVREGIAGYLSKGEAAKGLIDGLRSVLVDQRYFSPLVVSLLAEIVAGEHPDPATPTPTARQREVLMLLVQGQTDLQMGAALGVSERTIRYHLTNLFNKAGVSTRTELALHALKQGWITMDSSP